MNELFFSFQLMDTKLGKCLSANENVVELFSEYTLSLICFQQLFVRFVFSVSVSVAIFKTRPIKAIYILYSFYTYPSTFFPFLSCAFSLYLELISLLHCLLLLSDSASGCVNDLMCRQRGAPAQG